MGGGEERLAGPDLVCFGPNEDDNKAEEERERKRGGGKKKASMCTYKYFTSVYLTLESRHLVLS